MTVVFRTCLIIGCQLGVLTERWIEMRDHLEREDDHHGSHNTRRRGYLRYYVCGKMASVRQVLFPILN